MSRKMDVKEAVVRKRSPERPSLSQVRCLSYCQLLSASDSPHGRGRRSRTSSVGTRSVVVDVTLGTAVRGVGRGIATVLDTPRALHEAERHRSHRRRTVRCTDRTTLQATSGIRNTPITPKQHAPQILLWGATVTPGNADSQNRLARSRRRSTTARRRLES